MSDWPDRIAKALGEHMPGEGPSAIPDDIGEIAPVALEAIGEQALADAYINLENAWGIVLGSESPIEEAMFWAITILAREQFDSVVFRTGSIEKGGDAIAPDVLFIEPQAHIGDYRVDFLLTARSRSGFDEYVDAQLIVECDGHDFHERTKTQASRDRKRDRGLQTAGFLVYRYPGSDIYRDVAKCAREALKAVYRAARQKAPEA